MNVIGKCVAGSWITNNDTGDEDPSVVPERLAVIEIAPAPFPPPGLATLGRMMREGRAHVNDIRIDFDPDLHGAVEVTIRWRVLSIHEIEFTSIRDLARMR